MDYKENKGGALKVVIITMLIVILIGSIGIFVGTQIIEYSNFKEFSNELKIMQKNVDRLYDEIDNSQSLGKDISEDIRAAKIFVNCGILADKNDYRLFDTEAIQKLKIENVTGEYLVNLNTRSVLSYKGYEYKGKVYYTLSDLPDDLRK